MHMSTCTSVYPPGFFPFGLASVAPCPRPLVGLTGLGLCVGRGAGAGTYLVVVSTAVEGCWGFTEGFGGMCLVPAPELTDGIWAPRWMLVKWARNPSDVTLRSDTNWTKSTFPLVTMGLEKDRKGMRSKISNSYFRMTVKASKVVITHSGTWSPQNFPIRRESSLSPPLKNAT